MAVPIQTCLHAKTVQTPNFVRIFLPAGNHLKIVKNTAIRRQPVSAKISKKMANTNSNHGKVQKRKKM